MTVSSCALSEDFTVWPPAGWTIEDGGDSSDTWFQCDPAVTTGCDEGEFTLSSGPFALTNSDLVSGVIWDENLVTPELDCTGTTTVTLSFDHDFQEYSPDNTDIGEVEVSTDGGTVWVPVATYTADTAAAGESVSLNISAQAAGMPSVLIRFHYEGEDDWWWMVDTVAITSL